MQNNKKTDLHVKYNTHALIVGETLLLILLIMSVVNDVLNFHASIITIIILLSMIIYFIWLKSHYIALIDGIFIYHTLFHKTIEIRIIDIKIVHIEITHGIYTGSPDVTAKLKDARRPTNRLVIIPQKNAAFNKFDVNLMVLDKNGLTELIESLPIRTKDKDKLKFRTRKHL